MRRRNVTPTWRGKMSRSSMITSDICTRGRVGRWPLTSSTKLLFLFSDPIRAKPSTGCWGERNPGMLHLKVVCTLLVRVVIINIPVNLAVKLAGWCRRGLYRWFCATDHAHTPLSTVLQGVTHLFRLMSLAVCAILYIYLNSQNTKSTVETKATEATLWVMAYSCSEGLLRCQYLPFLFRTNTAFPLAGVDHFVRQEVVLQPFYRLVRTWIPSCLQVSSHQSQKQYHLFYLPRQIWNFCCHPLCNGDELNFFIVLKIK